MTTAKKEKFYVYGLIDPINSELRYVGKTFNIKQRYNGHLSKHELKEKNHKNNWIKLLLKNNVTPIISVLEIYNNEQEALDAEVSLIEYYKYIGCSLTNQTAGGQGLSGQKRSPETIRKIVETRRNGCGYKHTEETKHKISLAKTGHKQSDETKAKRSNKMKGFKHSEESKKKMSLQKKGRKVSESTKEKLRQINTGKKHSEETKQKISIANTGNKFPNRNQKGENNPFYGKHHTEETKQYFSNLYKNKSVNNKKTGTPKTEEHKQKISKSLTGRFTGENSPSAKLTWEKVNTIRMLYAIGGYSYKSLADLFDSSGTNIARIIKNEIWVIRNL